MVLMLIVSEIDHSVNGDDQFLWGKANLDHHKVENTYQQTFWRY